MSKYAVYVTPSALREIKELPGGGRQPAKRAIDALGHEPHPPGSKALNMPEDLK